MQWPEGLDQVSAQTAINEIPPLECGLGRRWKAHEWICLHTCEVLSLSFSLKEILSNPFHLLVPPLFFLVDREVGWKEGALGSDHHLVLQELRQVAVTTWSSVSDSGGGWGVKVCKSNKFQGEADIVDLGSHLPTGMGETWFTQVKTRGRDKIQGKKIKLLFAILHELPMFELCVDATCHVTFQKHLPKWNFLSLLC